MRKLINWLDDHILKIGVLFLLFFIPLWPKLPLIGVPHTWVYIRLEDILISLLVFIFFLQIIRRKVSLTTPLTLPIFIYWLIGGLSLIFCLLFLAKGIPNFFPNVAIFHYLRRIEYMSVFFIAFATIKSIKDAYHYLLVLVITILGVVLYGFGQKFFGFPAFLTMNEEFAKGIPLYLPPAARMTSTFAGHYDLAAFLVFVLPFLGSVFWGLKKWRLKIFLLLIGFGAYILLLFTASRISFVVYLLAISFMLFLQKKKWLIIPVVLLSLFVMREESGTSLRLGKTFRVQQVVYDVRTGKPIATLEEFEARPSPTPAVVAERPVPSPAAVSPPPTPYEELPLGSGFLEVPLVEKSGAAPKPRPIKTRGLLTASESADLATVSGEFLVKRAIVYDISFTTRFQGEWPRAIEAFKRNMLLGSGYSSISLATDNDYLRLLGETGILGLLGFLGILFSFLLMTRVGLRKIRNSFSRSVVIGVSAGVFGLMINAFLIDVFEASKVAYILWIMAGVAAGIYTLTARRKESLMTEALEFLKEPATALIIFALLSAAIFYSAVGNYFTADDFTWLRWAAAAKVNDIGRFFLEAHGFFYRPAVKTFLFVFHLFLGMKPQGYHLISFGVHFLSSSIVYLIIRLLTGNWFISLLTGLLFLIHPIHSETVLWVSGYSGLFAGLFYFASFYAFLRWVKKEKGSVRWIFYLGSLVFFALSLLSYESAITLPLILFFYLWVFRERKWLKGIFPYLILLAVYLYLRNVAAQAHLLSGDYSYNLNNFIFNFLGNLFGYFGEMLVGFKFIAFYDSLRFSLRENRILSGILLITVIGATFAALRFFKKRKMVLDKLAVFSLGWFVAALLPVLGLGNIAERYLYIPSFGFILSLSWLVFNLYQRINLGRLIRGGLLVIIIAAIFGFYYLEMEEVKKTWQEAGEISNKILRTLPTSYKEFPEGSTLYFVNLPLRVERAWVFPVGIEDGLWFVYRDETLKVMKGNDLNEALDYKESHQPAFVFIYENAELKEATRL